MNKILFSCLCAFLGLAAVAESTVVRIGRKTEVVSAPKYGVNLGTIDQHRVVDCSFSITNNNWRERAVLDAFGNCACLSVGVERKVLKRGEACRVKVLFNPAGPAAARFPSAGRERRRRRGGEVAGRAGRLQGCGDGRG